MTVPAHSFVAPWTNGRCKVQVGDAVYDVVQITMPPGQTRYYFASLNGGHVDMARRFPDLLKKLAAYHP